MDTFKLQGIAYFLECECQHSWHEILSWTLTIYILIYVNGRLYRHLLLYDLRVFKPIYIRLQGYSTQGRARQGMINRPMGRCKNSQSARFGV